MKDLEVLVKEIVEQTNKFPCDVRKELMKQMVLTSEQYVKQSNEIRGTLSGGKGFFGNPG